MNRYASFCDDFYLNMQLQTELDLPQQRETVLHFFEQIQRRYPSMKNFYTRERNELVLEEDKESGGYRWVAMELKRIGSGTINPLDLEDSIQQHSHVLELAPYELSVSRLDCESLTAVFGFDYTYRGNHNQLLADTIGVPAGLEEIANRTKSPIVGYEPSIQFTLDEECKTQVRLNFESRTTAFHVRTGEYNEEQISVYLSVRRYDSLGPDEDWAKEFRRLTEIGFEILDAHVIEHILQPLQSAIANK
jgi:hypothetical protein